ncbi:MAG: element excision factor XisH family protein [Bacteroidota bacterium]
MSRKDFYHEEVKRALINSGWTITHDPYTIKRSLKDRIHIDLGAEQLFAAEKGPEKIAVEVKNFVGPSNRNELHRLIGQVVDYTLLLKEVEPDRQLFVAVPEEAWLNYLQRDIIHANLRMVKTKLVIVDVDKQKIVEWISK